MPAIKRTPRSSQPAPSTSRTTLPKTRPVDETTRKARLFVNACSISICVFVAILLAMFNTYVVEDRNWKEEVEIAGHFLKFARSTNGVMEMWGQSPHDMYRAIGELFVSPSLQRNHTMTTTTTTKTPQPLICSMHTI